MEKLIIRSTDTRKGIGRKGAKKIRKEETLTREENMKQKISRRVALLKNMVTRLVPRTLLIAP